MLFYPDVYEEIDPGCCLVAREELPPFNLANEGGGAR